MAYKEKIFRRKLIDAATAALLLFSLEPLAAYESTSAKAETQEPSAPLNQLFLPSVEVGPKTEQETYQDILKAELLPYFPDLETVTVDLPPTNESLKGFVDSFVFWLRRIHPLLEASQSITKDPSDAPDMIQDTVKDFKLSFLAGINTTTSVTVDKTVVEIDMVLDNADPSGLAAEFIHLFQERNSISQGISTINTEGVSNIVHLAIMKDWVAYNRQHPQEPVLMPIFDFTTKDTITNPTVDQFNAFLDTMIQELTKKIEELRLGQYKHEYMGEDTLGRSIKYPRKWGYLLHNLDRTEVTSSDYQNSIEQHGALFAKVAIAHDLDLRQTIILSNLVNNGVDYTVLGTDAAVVDAYNDLKQQGLIVSHADWQANVQEFSQKTVEDLPLNVVFALKNEPFSQGDRLTLEAYQVVSSNEVDTAFYGPLDTADTPSAKLYFFVTKDDGSRLWYSVDIDVNSFDSSQKTLFYSLQLPDKVTVRDGIHIWQESLNGKDMVVEVKQEQLLGTPLGTMQSFEVKGVFPQAAAAQGEVIDETEALTPVAAPSPSGDVSPSKSKPTTINQVAYEEIVAALDNFESNTTITIRPNKSSR